MAALDNIASELLKSANEADLNYKKTRDQAQRDKAVRLRRIVENLKAISAGGLTPTLDEVLTEGNTSTNTLNVGGITTDYVQLDTTATPTPVQGMMFWDSDRSTVDVQLDADVSAKIGQDNFWYVKNQSGATIPKGKAVMAVGTLGASGRILIDEMVANGSISSKFLLGITAEDIANGADGFVMNIGKLRQVNTTIWPDGTVLYCDPTTPGNLTSTKPSSPNLALPVAFVVHSAANGVLAIRVSILDENALNTPTLAQVTTAGNTTTNAITVGNATTNNLTIDGTGSILVTQTAYNNLARIGTIGGYDFLYGAFRGLFIGNNTNIGRWGITTSSSQNLHIWQAANNAIIFATNNTEAMRIAPSNNVLIGTTTDAGYKLDVNGIARVVTRIDAGSFTPGAGASAYTFATTGTITAAGGYNLRSPIYGDSGFSGLGDSGGPTIYSNNATVARFQTVGGALNGTNIDILQGYNPGAGTGSVTGVRHSYALYPSADNTVSYTSFLSNPYWISAPFYNRITGPIRGFYFANGLYNTQKLVDVIAFESNGGRVVFAGETPSASGGVSRGVYLNQTLTAAANNDVLVGLDINPTYTVGAFTGVSNLALRVAFVSGRHISFTQKPGYADYGRIQFTNVTGAEIYSSGRIDLIPSDASQSVGLGNTITSQRLAASTNWGLYGPTAPGFSVGTNAAFGFLSNNFDVNTDSFVFAGPTGARHFFKVVQNNVPYFTIMPTGNVLINTTTDAGYKLDVNGTTRISNTLRVVGSAGYGSNVFEFGVNGGTGQNGYIDGYGRWFISNGGTNTLAATIGTNVLFLGQNANSAAIAFSNSNNIIGQWSGTVGTFNNTSTSETIIVVNNQSTANLYGLTIAGDQTAGQTQSKNLLTLSHWSNSGVQTFSSVSTAQSYNLINVNIAVAPTQPNKTLRGFYYNPSISGTALAVHRAIETTSGDVILNTQSATVNSGYTTVAVGGSTGVYFQMYVGPNPSAQNLRGQIWAAGNNLLFNNPSSGYLGLYTTLYSGITIFPTTGNVHVGTSATDAGYKLDVNGTARVKTDLKIETNTGGLTIEGDASGYPTLSINTLRSGVDRRNWKFATEQVSAGDFIFYRSSTGGGAANTVVYAISKDGNFGLGTSTPTDKFHIVDNTNGNKFARISAGGTDASAAWVAQNDQVDNVVYRVFGSAVTGTQFGQALARSASLMVNLGGTGKFLIGSYSSTDLIFGTSDQARMRLVDSTGNFLIGTMTDTGNKLTVSGNIDAQGYKVNNVLGFTGILNIPTNPPGQQNIDIQGGIVVNIF